MSRLQEVNKFTEYDTEKNIIIEPQNRYNAVKERLFDVINSYSHKVIVKAGLGHGKLLMEIAGTIDAYIVVVEPSLTHIKNFLNSNADNPDLNKINFIVGDFHEFPVDYYAADLLICIDYIDFLDSGAAVNEFKRALKFDGILFLSTVTLDKNDIDGIYDEFMKLIFPLHNDYYLPEDLTTFLTLKEFELIKNMIVKYNENLVSRTDHFSILYKTVSREKALEYIKSNKQDLTKFMNLDEKYNISEPYYFGVYMRKKPAKV
ncbi:MAG: class I SAM-dependent methyltransferase [Spirochaetes bacterium]|nr:class I SAM-dependent methyltransferase [Spirochaetota bacterium]